MRKILFILTFLILAACTPYKYTSKYSQNYAKDQRELLLNDLYNGQWIFEVDPIPLEDWITTQAETRKGYRIERSFLLKDDIRHEYLIIFSTYIEKDTVYYNLEILERNKFR
jgi:hypothetical protein